MNRDLEKKHRAALDILRSLEGAVVAFSGGVDSTLLLRLAKDALGERCVALTAVSPSLAERERGEARDLARLIGVPHHEVETNEVDNGEYAANPTNRCYFCKSELFDHCFEASRRLELPTVVYGATRDDLGDHRPGMGAARERGARAPLLEAELGKTEIRELSRELDLPTWDKPAMACLASRFPYGTPITASRLGRVEQAEDVLWREGFRVFRVRFHEKTARLELGAEEWERIREGGLRARIVSALREAGFAYVTVDLEPYRSGRLNESPESKRPPRFDAVELD